MQFLLRYEPLKIYLAGHNRGVDTLADGEMSAGNHRVVWNAARQASGVYLAILESEGKRDIRKVALVR